MKGFTSSRINIRSILEVFLTIGLLLLMFKSFRLYFTWNIPQTLVTGLGLTSCLLFCFFYRDKIFSRITFHHVLLVFSICAVFLYEILIISRPTAQALFVVFTTLVCSIFLILLDFGTRVRLLHYVTLVTQIIVGVSLIGWILFLLNIPLPHYYSDTDTYYTHTVYYLFLLNGVPEFQLMPRFAGLFLEPGHLGTVCCFLLYAEHFNFKKVGNVILLLGILFSFSLAAYGLLIGGVGLYLFFNSKRGVIYIILCILLFFTVWIISENYNSGDNYLYKRIFERLIFEDGQMKGSNRTSAFFDTKFNHYVASSDTWLGVGREALERQVTTTILIGCAGWKRYFFLRGSTGCFLLLLFLFSYWRKYPSVHGLAFLVLFLIANIIRDYPLREYFLFIYLLVIPLLSKKVIKSNR